MNPSIQPSQPIFVGRYADAAGKVHLLPVSAAELDRAREAMQRVISSLSFEMGNHVVLASLLDEAVQCLPFERAVMSVNMVVCSVDGSFFDAARFESTLRRFKVVAVGVLGATTLEGLAAIGFTSSTLLAGHTVWARPDAYERLRATPDIKVLRWLELGPAVAAECSHANGAHIDRLEWQLHEAAGEIVLSSRLGRCVPFTQYRTGLQGTVDYSPCRCGSPDPRIIPA